MKDFEDTDREGATMDSHKPLTAGEIARTLTEQTPSPSEHLTITCDEASAIISLLTPARCPHCGYAPDVIPSDFDAYAQANCEHRESHAEHALRAPAALSLNRRQRRCIRNAAERFDSLGYAFGAELRECFPEAFVSLGKGRM